MADLSWVRAANAEPAAPLPAVGLGGRAWLASAVAHGVIALAIGFYVHAPTPAAPASLVEIAVTSVEDAVSPPPVALPTPEAIAPTTVARIAPARAPSARVASAASAPAPAPAAVSPSAPAAQAPTIVAAAPVSPTFAMALPIASQGGNAAPVAPMRPTASEIVDERGVSTRAQVAYGPMPSYPREARAAEIETDVPVEIVVDPTGSVVDARLQRSVGYGIDEATLRAIKKYRFKPALKDGRAVAVRMQWTMQYRLE
jgi:periplasmic protein TonB